MRMSKQYLDKYLSKIVACLTLFLLPFLALSVNALQNAPQSKSVDPKDFKNSDIPPFNLHSISLGGELSFGGLIPIKDKKLGLDISFNIGGDGTVFNSMGNVVASKDRSQLIIDRAKDIFSFYGDISCLLSFMNNRLSIGPIVGVNVSGIRIDDINNKMYYPVSISVGAMCKVNINRYIGVIFSYKYHIGQFQKAIKHGTHCVNIGLALRLYARENNRFYINLNVYPMKYRCKNIDCNGIDKTDKSALKKYNISNNPSLKQKQDELDVLNQTKKQLHNQTRPYNGGNQQ